MQGSRFKLSSVLIVLVFPTAISMATYEVLTDIEPVSFQFEVDPEGNIPPLDPVFPFGNGGVFDGGFFGPSVTLAGLDFSGFINPADNGFGVPTFPDVLLRPNPAEDEGSDIVAAATLDVLGDGGLTSPFQFIGDVLSSSGSGSSTPQTGNTGAQRPGFSFPGGSPFNTGLVFSGGGSGGGSDTGDQTIAPVPVPLPLALLFTALGALAAFARKSTRLSVA